MKNSFDSQILGRHAERPITEDTTDRLHLLFFGTGDDDDDDDCIVTFLLATDRVEPIKSSSLSLSSAADTDCLARTIGAPKS